MNYWDSSAVVATLVREPATQELLSLRQVGERPVVWWVTPVECESAISRHERDGSLPAAGAITAREQLGLLSAMWIEILPTAGLRDRALRLLRTHPLRAADALQLAAAVQAAEALPENPMFVCLDSRLCEAARREGFAVLP